MSEEYLANLRKESPSKCQDCECLSPNFRRGDKGAGWYYDCDLAPKCYKDEPPELIKYYQGKYKVKILIPAPIPSLRDEKQCQVMALEEFLYDFVDGSGGARVLPGWRFNTYPEYLFNSATNGKNKSSEGQ